MTHVFSDLKEEETLLKRFTKKNHKKQIKKSLELKKVINRKGNKLYVEWKGYNSSFNSRIDKKDIVQMSEYFPEPKSLGIKES